MWQIQCLPQSWYCSLKLGKCFYWGNCHCLVLCTSCEFHLFYVHIIINTFRVFNWSTTDHFVFRNQNNSQCWQLFMFYLQFKCLAKKWHFTTLLIAQKPNTIKTIRVHVKYIKFTFSGNNGRKTRTISVCTPRWRRSTVH